MSPEDMAQVLRQLPKFKHPDLLVSMDTLDDAGVYRINEQTALVQTVDVLTPIVDDPYDYGCIVAANSLSDVYAMGGQPLTALNIIGFPLGKISHQVVSEILRGGAEKVKEAGAIIVGGHTIRDPEVKYGLAVTGVVHPQRIITNGQAKVGDILILTKPLGIGLITTANMNKPVPDDLLRRITRSMTTLNKTASEVMLKIGVNACTDVTGFGLFGHAYEIAYESKVSLEISVDRVPLFEEAKTFARQNMMPGGSFSNKKYYGQFVKVPPDIPEDIQDVCFDAQTSGGLLMAVANEKVDAMLKELHNQGVKDAAIIGEVVPKQAEAILLTK